MQIHSARFFVYATDLPQSLEFYTEVLRLRIVDRIVGGAVLAAGSAELELMQDRRDTEPDIVRRTGFTIVVDSADDAYTALQSQGVTIASELTTTPEGARVFFIVDPDGLPIGIRSELTETIAPGEWALDQS